MENQKHIHYLSFLKTIGMFAVIAIHVVCTPFSYFEKYYTKTGEFLSYFITNSLRAWAVPVFVMVSGVLFLGREITFEKICKKYLKRILLVTLIFGTLFAFMEIFFTERKINLSAFLRSLINVYSGKLWDHMWFLYMIAGLYLVTPFLQKMIHALSENEIQKFLVVLFVFSVIIPLADSITNIKFGWYIPFNSVWLFYYILGYAVHTETVKIRPAISFVFIISGILWCIAGQFISEMKNPVGASILYSEPSSLTGVMMALGIFSLAKTKCRTEENFIDTKIVPLSFGVYVVHAVFINFIYKALHFTPDRFNAFFVIAVTFCAVSVCSLCTVWILKKIPVIRKYIL